MKYFIALAAVATTGTLVGAAPASAAPSDKASCVAQFVHGPAGPPGQFQSEFHQDRFGHRVSEVAHGDRPECFV